VEESWPQFANELIALAEGRTRYKYEVPIRNGARERKELLLNLSVVPSSQATLRACWFHSLISPSANNPSHVSIFLAYHDRLTGCPIVRCFFDRLSQAMSQARRSRKHVALLFLDLDGFKPVNDMYGHEQAMPC